ncbi:TlpA family protein disulfide reductase [Belliella kenyensis]|uniref:TlpA family protein disulfide reductase n=1 Tax=Belliella kenyensis TaxID=1472724 RepID=A0ABV8EMC4_9BACT|nr:TlpA disulfide reductase family protein [Belliella kenyensis]MCH7400542.1 TlpA family protein disulfide reductase [Belliella kenyensis]MDN3602171.1 TlpA disulfide reductase family protein [Belliella kenyensis]
MKTLVSVLLSLVFILNATENVKKSFKEDFNKVLSNSAEIPALAPGEVAVINLWATWCGPCIKEIPEMNEIVEEYNGKNVRFLAFSEENRSVYETFLSKRPDFKFSYEMSFGNKEAASIIKALDQSEYKGRAIPIHVLVDKDGQVVDTFIGASPMNIQKIKNFLSEHASAE